MKKTMTLVKWLLMPALLIILAGAAAPPVGADNTFSLVFDANGGSKAHARVTRVSKNTFAGYRFDYIYPVRKGYAFHSWNTRKDGKGKSYRGGSLMKLTKKSTTLYAVWKKGSRSSIEYVPSGGSDWPAETFAVSQGSSNKLKLAADLPVRKGFRFSSWNTRANGSGTSYKPGQAVVLKAGQKLKLYAIWLQTYTYELTFDANGGTGAPAAITKSSENKSVAFEIPSTVPERSGYTFTGWNTMVSGRGTARQPGGTLVRRMGSPKATLYAMWKEAPPPKIDTAITWTDEKVVYGDEVHFDISPAEATGTVALRVGGRAYTGVVENGKASIWTGIIPGTYEATAEYSGDSAHNPSVTAFQLVIKKADVSITSEMGDEINIYYGSALPYLLITPSDATGTLLLSFDGVLKYSDIENGRAKIPFRQPGPGEYMLNVQYQGDDCYRRSYNKAIKVILRP